MGVFVIENAQRDDLHPLAVTCDNTDECLADC